MPFSLAPLLPLFPVLPCMVPDGGHPIVPDPPLDWPVSFFYPIFLSILFLFFFDLVLILFLIYNMVWHRVDRSIIEIEDRSK